MFKITKIFSNLNQQCCREIPHFDDETYTLKYSPGNLFAHIVFTYIRNAAFNISLGTFRKTFIVTWGVKYKRAFRHICRIHQKRKYSTRCVSHRVWGIILRIHSLERTRFGDSLIIFIAAKGRKSEMSRVERNRLLFPLLPPVSRSSKNQYTNTEASRKNIWRYVVINSIYRVTLRFSRNAIVVAYFKVENKVCVLL